ncbi:protein-L-isoaspartate(D-aspartate) O-methyltransferase [Pleomorphovibrio marinus]|uniref:protein-L-isoaspartate(D-aspartate) O-methyltransferase n=1 Tax=Pleomorphovibrio marinus TaxID=2164132 RepID=UPI000E0B1A80|nr:protein-L-isoaspartate(D-aspartate) O-methyltransferase [Pleomorphovibrio marinus]
MYILWFLCVSFWFQTDRFEEARHKMVTDQLAKRGIKEKSVLEAMRKVPRHLLVPESQKDNAYLDRPLPIGQGQTISQPYIVALMTEQIHPEKDMKVLEIGTGSGYQAAVLAELVKEVYTVEIVSELGKKAKSDLKELGYENVSVKIGDGYQGWAEHAPYDAIIVTAAPEEVPKPLLDQLKEGGRMIIPVGPVGQTQELLLVEKIDGEIKKTKKSLVRFVPFTRSPQAD